MHLEIIEKRPVGVSQKTPVLFVHGAWHGAWCWNEFFLPYFAEQGYTSYALSIQGHGSSDEKKKLNSLRISDYVADLAQVVADLPNPPVLVGHSMGGHIVQKYLEKYSAPAAVLLASLPTGGAAGAALRIFKRHPWLFLKTNLTINLHPVVSTSKLVREAFFSDDMDTVVLEKYFSQIQDESYFAFLDMILLNLPKPKKITTPLFVLGGANDRIFSSKEVASTAKAYNTHAKIIENMAHDMMLEKGWQKVADTIIAWLKEKNL
jgi:pimeloyl-ACP methyl ester carboxylesterase